MKIATGQELLTASQICKMYDLKPNRFANWVKRHKLTEYKVICDMGCVHKAYDLAEVTPIWRKNG